MEEGKDEKEVETGIDEMLPEKKRNGISECVGSCLMKLKTWQRPTVANVQAFYDCVQRCANAPPADSTGSTLPILFAVESNVVGASDGFDKWR